MKFFTQAAAVIALSGLIAATPVMAQTTSTPSSQQKVELSSKNSDLSFAFDNAQNLQVKSLTNKEMKDTEAAGFWIPFLIGAALLLTPTKAHAPTRDPRTNPHDNR